MDLFAMHNIRYVIQNTAEPGDHHLIQKDDNTHYCTIQYTEYIAHCSLKVTYRRDKFQNT